MSTLRTRTPETSATWNVQERRERAVAEEQQLAGGRVPLRVRGHRALQRAVEVVLAEGLELRGSARSAGRPPSARGSGRRGGSTLVLAVFFMIPASSITDCSGKLELATGRRTGLGPPGARPGGPCSRRSGCGSGPGRPRGRRRGPCRRRRTRGSDRSGRRPGWRRCAGRRPRSASGMWPVTGQVGDVELVVHRGVVALEVRAQIGVDVDGHGARSSVGEQCSP